MPKWCAALGCTNESDRPLEGDKRISFHLFPRDPQTKQEWISATKRNNFIPGNHASLCSEHFEENCFVPGLTRRKLFPNAVPTIFKSSPDYVTQPSISEEQLESSSVEKRIIAEITTALNKEDTCIPTASEVHKIMISVATRDSATSAIGENDDLRRRIEELEKTVYTLQRKLQKSRRQNKVKSMENLRLAQKFANLIATRST